MENFIFLQTHFLQEIQFAMVQLPSLIVNIKRSPKIRLITKGNLTPCNISVKNCQSQLNAFWRLTYSLTFDQRIFYNQKIKQPIELHYQRVVGREICLAHFIKNVKVFHILLEPKILTYFTLFCFFKVEVILIYFMILFMFF